MTQKPKAVKLKVLIGYFLLFSIGVVSVWFIYSEILKVALPDEKVNDENKIIRISNIITTLYASESAARNSILTGSSSDYDEYITLLDSATREIDEVKKDMDAVQLAKLDSVQVLLQKKESSVNEIILFRNHYNQQNTFNRAIGKIYKVKDSLFQLSPTVEGSRHNPINQFINQLRDVIPPEKLDSLRKQPVSPEALTVAFDKMLTDLIIADNRMRFELFRKEQKAIDDNRMISDQLRIVLSSLEQEILSKSYKKINESRQALENMLTTLSIVGAVTFCLLILFAWIIIKDLTNHQNYRRQLEELNREKENLLKSKTMLMATVTHDLQTPLGSIIGFTDLLKDTNLSTKQNQYIGNIKSSSDYILQLVNDLLDFSKLENNKIKIEENPFNPKQLIDKICLAQQPQARNKNIELAWDVEGAIDRNYISDPYRIKQILTNLVSNAIKFTQEGSVEVTGKKEGRFLVFSVIDTGIGIAKERQEDVFKEFTQAHEGIEKKFGGTGLGLTISRRMLELLGGSISLKSEEGKGSVFTIVIPAIEEEKKEIPKITAENEELQILKGKQILVIDDDPLQLSLMQEILGRYPLKVVTTSEPGQAIEILEREIVHLVLSDIQMPKMDGFEFVRIIRDHTNATVAKLPVIALSGKRDLSEEDFVSFGFTAHHPKPIQLERLIGLLKQILSDGTHQRPELLPESPLERKNSQALYNLDSLAQFTYGDLKALKGIIKTFVKTTRENSKVLLKATKEKDKELMSNTAHKMIPMLKQMEVFHLSDKLEPIEDNRLTMDEEEIEEYVSAISEELENLCQLLLKEFD